MHTASVLQHWQSVRPRGWLSSFCAKPASTATIWLTKYTEVSALLQCFQRLYCCPYFVARQHTAAGVELEPTILNILRKGSRAPNRQRTRVVRLHIIALRNRRHVSASDLSSSQIPHVFLIRFSLLSYCSQSRIRLTKDGGTSRGKWRGMPLTNMNANRACQGSSSTPAN